VVNKIHAFQENERGKETLSVAILSSAIIAITWKTASSQNAQHGQIGECGPSAACLVAQEQSQEHETAAVTSSAQVNFYFDIKEESQINKFQTPVLAMATSILQFPSAISAATPARITTPPEHSSTSGMHESMPAPMMLLTWDTLTL